MTIITGWKAAILWIVIFVETIILWEIGKAVYQKVTAAKKLVTA